LYCSIYLIIIGISGFVFNHNTWFERTPQYICEYKKNIEINAKSNKSDSIKSICEQVGIYGNHIFWEDYTDSLGSYHFKIRRPGKLYEISYNGENTIVVKEYSSGIIDIICGLHTMSSGNPPSFVSSIWRWYAESAAIVSFLVIIISVWFWFKKSLRTNWQWYITSFVFLSLLIFILHIWLQG